MTVPYTYLITFLPSNQKYYGVRYAQGCHPTDLGVKYFSSSKYLLEMFNQYNKSDFKFEVRKIFHTAEQACQWERKVLRRLKVHLRNDYINKVHNFTFAMYNPEVVKKVVEANKASGLFIRLGKERGIKNKERIKNGFDHGSISRKSYIVTFTDGTTQYVSNLKEFAAMHNARYDSLRSCVSSGRRYPSRNIQKVALAEGVEPSLQGPQPCVQTVTLR